MPPWQTVCLPVCFLPSAISGFTKLLPAQEWQQRCLSSCTAARLMALASTHRTAPCLMARCSGAYKYDGVRVTTGYYRLLNRSALGVGGSWMQAAVTCNSPKSTEWGRPGILARALVQRANCSMDAASQPAAPAACSQPAAPVAFLHGGKPPGATRGVMTFGCHGWAGIFGRAPRNRVLLCTVDRGPACLGLLPEWRVYVGQRGGRFQGVSVELLRCNEEDGLVSFYR